MNRHSDEHYEAIEQARTVRKAQRAWTKCLVLGALYQAQHEAAEAGDWRAFDALSIKIGALHDEAGRTEDDVLGTSY